MATEEDNKIDPPPHPTEEQAERAMELISPKDGVVAIVHDSEEEFEEAAAPVQLGYQRYVYAGYFAGAIAVAFFCSKLGELVWMRLAAWKPVLGEPRGDVVMPISALIAVGVAWYYWRKQRTRELAEEVASELSKVTWPTRDEVMSSTTVVIITTLLSTIFFALMDRFWSFLTNLVYGT